MRRRMDRKNKKKKHIMISLLTIISVIIGGFFITTTVLSNIKTKKHQKMLQAVKDKELAKKREEEKKNRLKSYEYPASEVEKIVARSNENSSKSEEDSKNKTESESKGKNKKLQNNKPRKTIPKDKKIAFLTMDDGPSTTVTPKVLDVLKEKGVKATFFLVGETIDQNKASKNLVKRIYNEGHAIGNHSYTHNMKKLYPHNKLNIENFMNEVNKTNESIKKALGKDFYSKIIRMPGGYMSRKYYNDPNLPEFNKKLKERKMHSIDWNALSGDAEGGHKNKDELLQFLKDSIGSKKQIVILTHDTYGKESSAKALPLIIDYLKSQGYEFGTIR